MHVYLSSLRRALTPPLSLLFSPFFSSVSLALSLLSLSFSSLLSSHSLLFSRREEVALRKLFLRNAFLERLPRAEWDDPFQTKFWSLATLHGVVQDQNEGVLLSRVESLRRSAQEMLKASVSG